jgi:hypothetical protein
VKTLEERYRRSVLELVHLYAIAVGLNARIAYLKHMLETAERR